MSSLKYAFLFASCLAATTWAAADSPDANEPAPAPQPPPAVAQHRGEGRRRGSEVRTGAFVGVSTSPTSRVLQRQLGLPEGMGLVVDFIAPHSPAEQAGLHEDDVLQKLDDQLLINSEQLAILVRSHKPGDEVKLTVLRDGKPQVLTAKLEEHELSPLDSFDFDRGFPPMLRSPTWLLPPFGQRVPGDVAPPPPADRPGRMSPPPAGAAAPGDHDYSVTYVDGNRVYSITMRNGRQTLTVNDADHTLFDGPIDTQQQRDRLPPDVRATLDRMIRSHLLPEPTADRHPPTEENGSPPTPQQ